MSHLLKHTELFLDIAKNRLEGMFSLTELQPSQVEETKSLTTKKSFIVSIYYTGTVYGEYIIAMDEETAAKAIGLETPILPENREEVREEIRDAFAETLNMIVGEAIVDLQKEYPKLTFASPRVFFGEVRYPSFRTGKGILDTSVGQFECHFCIDSMRLDLATSYEEVIHSLLDVNEKLKDANRHLAEQQAQLVQSEKLASVGMLAAGVAHEINNPLFFVDTNLNVLNDYIEIIETTFGIYESLVDSIRSMEGEIQSHPLKQQGDDRDIDHILEDTKALMAETCDGVRRIKAIVRGLKEFSQLDRGEMREADLNEIVENSIQLVQHQFKDKCQLETSLTDVPRVVCNSGEIAQVLVNLLLNAGQAIDGNGKIEIRTESNESEAIFQVVDDGCGIPETNIGRIFDPFFTTKPVGEGTGLGLSISYGILKKHQGSIDVASEAGKGSIFTVRLPLAPSHSLAAAH